MTAKSFPARQAVYSWLAALALAACQQPSTGSASVDVCAELERLPPPSGDDAISRAESTLDRCALQIAQSYARSPDAANIVARAAVYECHAAVMAVSGAWLGPAATLEERERLKTRIEAEALERATHDVVEWRAYGCHRLAQDRATPPAITN